MPFTCLTVALRVYHFYVLAHWFISLLLVVNISKQKELRKVHSKLSQSTAHLLRELHEKREDVPLGKAHLTSLF